MTDQTLMTPTEITPPTVKTLWDECMVAILGGGVCSALAGANLILLGDALRYSSSGAATFDFAVCGISILGAGISFGFVKENLSRYAAPTPPAPGS